MHRSSLPACCLRLGVLYLLIGLALGTVMGMKQDFAFRDVHAHVNLLGFVSTFLVGLFLNAYPSTLGSRLTHVGVWIILISVPLMLLFLTIYFFGVPVMGPFLGIASLATIVGYVLFAIAVFQATGRET